MANNLFPGANLAQTNHNNRRSDTSVRNAIDAIQDLLFDPQAAAKIYPLTLEHISHIANCDFGVFFIPEQDNKGEIARGSAQRLKLIYKQNSTPFISGKAMEHWVAHNLLPHKPVYFNSPLPGQYGKLLLAPQQIAAVAILPITVNDKLQAICCLAKSRGCFDNAQIRRLKPLLGSVVCALQTAESVKGNLLDLNQKISDNRFLSTLISTSPLAIMVVGQDRRIVMSNPNAEAMFCVKKLGDEYRENCLNGGDITRFLPKFEELFQWSKQQDRYGELSSNPLPRLWQDQIAYRSDDSEFIVNLSIFRYTHASSRYTTLQIQDITAIRENAEEHQQTSQQLSVLTQLVPVGILRVDKNWQCVYANDKWYEFSGLTQEESNGEGWINCLHSDEVKRVLECLREALQRGREFHSELRLISPLGQVRWVDFHTKVLFDEKGAVQGFLATIADITERLLHQERLRHVAEYDNLTGLANRNLLQDRLKQAFYTAEREDAEVVLMFLDLDGFKDVNDSLGHGAGDLLLRQVAERLGNTLRRNDTVARFGGDEFVVLLSVKDQQDPCLVAEKLIATISEPYFISDQEVQVTTSIGVARGKTHKTTPEKMLKQADAALYLAKKEGKNNYQCFSESLDKQEQQRIQLGQQLRSAMQKERFFLVYQPQASVADGSVVGYEALLRFTNDAGDIVSPQQFIPLLEDSGKIIEVGRWIIDEACKQLHLWQATGSFPENGFLSINVSPKQLLEESIISVILNACNKYQIQPQQLVVEITETAIIEKPQKVQKALQELKSIGVTLALDDFGTGYSSLSYLQNYPFDHIKIDRSFVADLLSDENDAKITKAMIALASSLGLKITAEGVADAQSLEVLKAYGANYYQGFFLGRPELARDAIQIAQKPRNVIPILHAAPTGKDRLI